MPRPATTIRPYAPDDAIALSRLIGHTMLTTNTAEYPVERLRELAEWFSAARVAELNETRTCLVAEQGAAVVGTIGIEAPLEASDGLETTLVTFFVSPGVQGQGVGTQLLEAIEVEATAHGITTIHLESSLAGAGFYRSHGFVPTGRTVTGHAGDHVEMTKYLGASHEGAAPGLVIGVGRPNQDEMVELYDSVGWTAYTADPASLARGVRDSLHVVTARIDGRLVGLARVVGDGATICYLQDVLVHPDHRRQGLGARLVSEVFAPYPDVRQHVLITDTEPGQRAFYEALGFSLLGDAVPGRAFIRFTNAPT